MARYMVIEHFAPGWKDKVYAHFYQQGRLLPEGLHYIDSWLTKDGERCFQLMETDNPKLFDVWKERWDEIGPWGSIEVIELGKKPGEGGE